MELDVNAMLSEVGDDAALLMKRCVLLAGENGFLRRRLAEAEAQLAAAKPARKAKTKE